MKENERFFGLHFDFHADNDADIGSRTSIEDIEWYIKAANPDFIQCDSKGHLGKSSYPTKIGAPAERITADNLKIWSDAAKKNGIPLYVHHSGVFDHTYTKAHPEEAQLYENGAVSNNASLFGKYTEEYLIPQIKEMIDMYDIAGVWMDGDCWCVETDYSKLAEPYMKNAKTPQERDSVMRDAFISYLKKCGDEFHKHKPDFKYISNWAYSSYMPEKPVEGVLDSLSGDYPSNDSVYVARYEGRCLAAQNMPWDLMCWSFSIRPGQLDFYTVKSEEQIKQEAAAVLMLGGGFQLYITQNRDGSAKRNEYKPLKGISEFVNARRMLFKKKPIAQVGIYYSKTSRYKHGRIYNASGATNSLIGAVYSVLNAQYTANIVLEYQIDTLSQYDMIVIPEWNDMSAFEKEKLVKYAENGGNLIAMGCELSSQIAELCGIETGERLADPEAVFNDMDEKRYDQYRYIRDEDGGFERIFGGVLDLKCGEDYIYFETDTRDKLTPAYSISDYGKGKIALIPFDFGSNYCQLRTQKKCRFLKKIMNKLATPFIEINKTNIDISVLENGEGGIYVNLLNLYRNRYDMNYDIFDEVPPVYDVELVINKPYKNISMPLGEEFTYEVRDNRTYINIKKVDIHSIIRLD